MKLLNLITCIPMMTTTPLLSATESSESQQPRPPITLQKGRTTGHVHRPQAPDRQVITCIYDGDLLIFSLVIPEGNSIITVTDKNNYYDTFPIDASSLEISVQVGTLIGDITVQMDTEHGNHFYGTLFEGD